MLIARPLQQIAFGGITLSHWFRAFFLLFPGVTHFNEGEEKQKKTWQALSA